MSERADRIAQVAQAAGKHIGGPGVRELGEVAVNGGATAPDRDERASELAARTLDLLRDEVEQMARLRAEFAAEKAAGAPATSSPRLDALAARLEGATRLALRLGLVSPAEARQVWHEAAQAGMHDRPAQGQPDRPRPEAGPNDPTSHEGTNA